MPVMKIPYPYLDSRYVNTSGDSMSGSLTLPNTGLLIQDTNASHTLNIKPGSDLTGNKILTLTTGDADRTINLSGDPTLGDWFDQGVKQASSPTHAGLTLTGFSGYVKATAGVLSAGAIADGDLPATIKGLTLTAQAVGFTIAGGTISKTLTVPLDASVSGTNTGDDAPNSSTMYIGTTAHALSRVSAAEGLAGITSLTPATNFTLVQNSVNVVTSVESGALINTLYLSAGKVGIGTAAPAQKLEVTGNIKLTDGVDRYIYGPTNAALNILGYLWSFFADRTASDCFTWQTKNAAGSYIARMTIGPSGVNTGIINFPNVNVGINTTGPDRKLDILDASNPQLRLTHTDGTVYSEFQTDASGNLNIAQSGTKVVVPYDLQINGTAFFDAEFDNGDSGAADTIDWTVGNKQKSTLTASCIYTFTAPGGPCNLLLKIVQGGAGSYLVTWPATVKWPNAGTPPTLSTAVGAIDIVAFYYDGTNYFGSYALDFQE